MAHVAHELRLDPHALERRVARAAQFLLGVFAFRDVHRDPFVVADFAGGVAYYVSAYHAPDDRSIGTAELRLPVFNHAIAREKGVKLRSLLWMIP